jgi:SOS response associated peptidase (SRAP)
MCGRFETTGKFTWAEIHEALSTIAPVTTPPLNLQPDDDVRPTTMQTTARLESDGWVVERMRWGLVPFWRSGKPLKDTEKGRDDGFKLSTFNARSETCAGTSTFREAYANAAASSLQAHGSNGPAVREPRSNTASLGPMAISYGSPGYGIASSLLMRGSSDRSRSSPDHRKDGWATITRGRRSSSTRTIGKRG